MTIMQKAIMQAIKEHNTNRTELNEYNKGIKLESTEAYTGKICKKYGDTHHCEYNEDYSECKRIEDIYMNLTVKCSFKPENKYDNNIVMYQVMMISNGDIAIYFDGTEYRA